VAKKPWTYVQALNNCAIVRFMKSAGHTLDDTVAALAEENDRLGKELQRLRQIAPTKIELSSGGYLVQHCADDMIPVTTLPAASHEQDIHTDVCPDFECEPERVHDILSWADAKVVWSDEFINGEGTVTRLPKFGAWALSWKNGVISFLNLSENDEMTKQQAMCASALFIWLWTRGIPARHADKLAEAYVEFFDVTWAATEKSDG